VGNFDEQHWGISVSGITSTPRPKSRTWQRIWPCCNRWDAPGCAGTTPRPSRSGRRSRPSSTTGTTGPPKPKPRLASGRWIEERYNRKRRHSSIGMLTPVGFEQLQLQTAQAA